MDHPVIIVDDSKDDRDFLSHLLVSILPKRKEVVQLTSGKELLVFLENLEKENNECERFQQDIPDMIFLDLVMPELDGIETLKKVRNKSVWCDIPITLITQSMNNKAIDEAQKSGANAFLPKPYSLFDVIKTLNKANNFAPTLL